MSPRDQGVTQAVWHCLAKRWQNKGDHALEHVLLLKAKPHSVPTKWLPFSFIVPCGPSPSINAAQQGILNFRHPRKISKGFNLNSHEMLHRQCSQLGASASIWSEASLSALALPWRCHFACCLDLVVLLWHVYFSVHAGDQMKLASRGDFLCVCVQPLCVSPPCTKNENNSKRISRSCHVHSPLCILMLSFAAQSGKWGRMC